MDDPQQSTTPPPPKISPEVSLDLRIRWLETLLYGSKQDVKTTRAPDTKNSTTLVRGVEELQQRLSAIVQTNEGLKRFVDHCEFLVSIVVQCGPQALACLQMNNMQISLRRPLRSLPLFT